MKRVILGCLALLTTVTLLGDEPCTKEKMIKRSLCNSIPVPKCSRGLYFNIGLIAEQMRITGTEAAVIFNIDPSTFKIVETVPDIKLDLDVGLRVGLGFATKHDDFHAKASFEWLSSKGNYAAAYTTGTTVLLPYGLPAITVGDADNPLIYQTVSASLNVDYFLLDLLLTKGSYFSTHFSFEPFAGIKASWINYNKKNNFSLPAGGSELGQVALLLNSKVDFWGVGPMIGLNANYFLVAGWSIFSSADFAILVGESKLKNSQHMDAFDEGLDIGIDINVFQDFNVLSPTMRVILGLQYDAGGFNDDQNVSFRVGFDGRCYWNQNPTVSRISVDGNSDIPFLVDMPFINRNNTYSMIGALVDLGWYF